MTDDEIIALLAPEGEEPPSPNKSRERGRVRVAAELFSFAGSCAEGGKLVRAMEILKVADQMVRTAKRLADLERPAMAVTGDGPGLDHVLMDQPLGLDRVMNIVAAKAHLSALVAAALGGGSVVLCRAGHPVARIVPYTAALAASRGSESD